MVRILSKYDDFRFLEWRQVKSSENIASFWEADVIRVLVFYEFCKILPIGHFEFLSKRFVPGWMYFYGHGLVLTVVFPIFPNILRE